MTTALDTLDTFDSLSAEFANAREELARARGRQLRKDTPVNRAAVARACALVDAVLDMYLDLR